MKILPVRWSVVKILRILIYFVNLCLIFELLSTYFKSYYQTSDKSHETLKSNSMDLAAWREELMFSAQFITSEDFEKYLSPLEMPKITYLGHYKNPCWYEKNKVGSKITIRCLPYFFLAGVEKCGTTDLYKSLSTHPMIENTIRKEPHYWSKGRLLKNSNVDMYMTKFSDPAINISKYIIRDSGKNIYHPKITLDASADTFLFNYAWKKFGQEMLDPGFYLNTMTPHHIKHVLPDAKFVVILRNPIDRLYSSYNFFAMLDKESASKHKNVTTKELKRDMLFHHKSPEDFQDKVIQALAWFRNCTDYYSTSLKCLFWNENIHGLHSFVTHLQIGFYGPTLLQWLKVFPKEQFKIVRLEDYSKDKISILNEIFEFLNLDPVTQEMKEEIEKSDIENFGRNQKKHGAMLNKTREILSNFYKPFNDMLVNLLHDERFRYM